MKRVLVALTIAVCLAGGLHAQQPEKIDDPVTQDGTIPEPMCMIYILFGIPIPSGECLCLITGWC